MLNTCPSFIYEDVFLWILCKHLCVEEAYNRQDLNKKKQVKVNIRLHELSFNKQNIDLLLKMFSLQIS